MSKNFRSLLTSPFLKLISWRYFGYGLGFINAIFAVEKLGFSGYGIYGFFILCSLILSYGNFGAQYSLLYEGVREYDKYKTIGVSFQYSLVLTFIASAIIFPLLVVPTSGSLESVLDKYEYGRFVYFLIMLVFLKWVNVLLLTYYRILGGYSKINLFYVLPYAIDFFVILVFDSPNLLDALFRSAVISQVLILVVFLRTASIKSEEKATVSDFFYYIRRSISLLIYNISFYGLLLLIRSLASIYLDTESFGELTLAINISTGIAMIGGSLQFLMSPKLISRFSSRLSGKRLLFEVSKVTDSYLLFSASVYIVSLFLMLTLAPLYRPFQSVLVLCGMLFIAQHLYDHCFAMVTSLTSAGKEKSLLLPALLSYGLIVLLAVGLDVAPRAPDPLSFSILLLAVYGLYLVVAAYVLVVTAKVGARKFVQVIGIRFSGPATVCAILLVLDLDIWIALLVWLILVIVLNASRFRVLSSDFLSLVDIDASKMSSSE